MFDVNKTVLSREQCFAMAALHHVVRHTQALILPLKKLIRIRRRQHRFHQDMYQTAQCDVQFWTRSHLRDSVLVDVERVQNFRTWTFRTLKFVSESKKNRQKLLEKFLLELDYFYSCRHVGMLEIT
jgi:hypothetical protein